MQDCLICKRIKMIKNNENPYFVKELETGYVVLGDHQRFKGYTLFLCKKHAQQRMLRANKNLIPKGSKFKIKKIEIKEVRKRT